MQGRRLGPDKSGSPGWAHEGVPDLSGEACRETARPRQVGESGLRLERNVARREFHPPHIYIQETCYFITASIVRGQWLMRSDAKRALFRDILREAIQRWDVRLFAWVGDV